MAAFSHAGPHGAGARPRLRCDGAYACALEGWCWALVRGLKGLVGLVRGLRGLVGLVFGGLVGLILEGLVGLVGVGLLLEGLVGLLFED